MIDNIILDISAMNVGILLTNCKGSNQTNMSRYMINKYQDRLSYVVWAVTTWTVTNRMYSFPGLLLYFLYGIHHSKLGEGVTGLLSRSGSGGGHSGGWGAVEKTNALARRVGRLGRGSKSDDRKPIICDEELDRRDP